MCAQIYWIKQIASHWQDALGPHQTQQTVQIQLPQQQVLININFISGTCASSTTTTPNVTTTPTFCGSVANASTACAGTIGCAY